MVKCISGLTVNIADVVKGYEYEDGKYVVITNEEFEAIKSEKDKSVQIIHFTDLSTIPPVYFDTSYHLIPEKGGEKAFELLRQLMLKSGKVAVGKMVLRTKETLLALVPTEEGILFETLFFADEVRNLPKAFSRPEVNDQELKVGATLIEAMDKPFDPSLYFDEYQQRLAALIEQKVNNEEIVLPKDTERSDKIIDIMEALTRTVEQAKAENKPAKKPSRRKPKGA